MKSFYLIIGETRPGADIQAACREAVQLATDYQQSLTFVFNGISVTARPGDDPEALYRAWDQDQHSWRKRA